MTPLSSAIFLTRFRPAMQFSLPSSSGMPGAIAREGDDVGNLGLRGALDVRPASPLPACRGFPCDSTPSGMRPAPGVIGGNQTVLPDGRPVRAALQGRCR